MEEIEDSCNTGEGGDNVDCKHGQMSATVIES
jgi:hypothetical protein